MRVIRLHGVQDLRLHNEPEPMPGPEEALVRVKAVGLCGSDMHWFAESGIGDVQLSRPLVLGHEFAGVVESSPVLPRGQLVAIDPAIPCNRCEYCLTGNPNFCTDLYFAGHGENDGALRDSLAWANRALYPLPDSLTAADGAMLEPLGIALHSVDLGHLRPGMSVGVFGCGPIGLLIVQLARISGATNIIATDCLPHRVAAARELGATLVFQAAGGEENAAVWAATGGRGVDVAFEAAGENPAVETAVESACSGGKVILVGIPADDSTTFTASTARRKGLTLKLIRRMKHTYPRSIQLVESGLVDVRALVTHRFPLDQIHEAFAVANSRAGIKVVVET